MAALDLLVVGPASCSTGGIAQFLTEQERHLPSSVDMTVHDDGTVDDALAERPASVLSSTLGGFAELLEADQPGVIHVHTSHSLSFLRSAVYVFYAANAWEAGVVLHIHGSSFDDFLETENPATRRLQSAVFEATDAVIVLSEYWRQALEGRVDEEKIEIVPNGVDIDEYDPTPIVDERSTGQSDRDAVAGDGGGSPVQPDGDVPTVTFVSNHVPRKGITELVEAIDRLKRDGVGPFEARIAGDGPVADRAESLADEYESVEYFGYVSEAEKRTLLAESSIYALPSYAEGLPFALLEGMAAGNAVLTTDVGSIPEVVDEDNGRLVSPGDVDQLTDALGWLIEQPEAVRGMGERNYRLARADYSWDAVVDRLVSVYGTVAPESTTSP
jgi:glycosyltransferase involved in cell wall biosynthesis